MENLGSLIFLLIVFAMGYFLLIRPQKQRQDQQRALIQSLAIGDDVVTIGGLYGRIDDLGEEWADLVVFRADDDEVVLRFSRASIARVVAAPAGSAEDDSLEDDDSEDDSADEHTSDADVVDVQDVIDPTDGGTDASATKD